MDTLGTRDATDSRDTARVKALYYRFTEALLDTNDPGALDALVTPGFVDHSLPPGTPPGPEGLRRFRAMVNGALSDHRPTVEDVIAEGDKVVGRVRVVGTHTGPLMGVAPTGRPVDIEAIEILRLEGGRVAERWNQRDGIGLLQQLGTFPPAPPADERQSTTR